MAPIRRYLRITKYSVLECRIYLDNPALAQSWLLNPRNPVLPRVIESVRPLVLPKLREERERARKRSTRKKNIKDVVVEDDFEVSIFLTETTTRHSLLTKHKHFHDTTQTKLTSNNAGRLITATNEAPIDVDLLQDAAAVALRREDSEDDAPPIALADIPTVDDTAATVGRPKRARRSTADTEQSSSEHDARDSGFEVISSDEEDAAAAARPPPHKRRKDTLGVVADADGGGDDDKKKLTMDVTYEGFSIYGRVLCLVVKRREVEHSATGRNSSRPAPMALGAAGGQTIMENFIISTQMPAGEDAA
ncbi:uncharacterized protein BCR38DRAFT_356891 [Pseudomassariella vexata]|uniref:Uncharacterized protein n=1 Tax=Pseudomassariella vexata TaxID=1141098 RepID=A0A1Y2D8R5_9PEZI|nr:uncharacterized protein BCR38DRAFT_356891 [Pseudomassariella vexata]ORY55516.1 hypothetical protein BCR38DRAFT_356891 [Pseudomassariella vexata]